MQSKIRHRKGAAKRNDVDEDTPDFLLNRSVTIKHDVEVEKEYRIYEFLGSGKFGDVNRCEEKATGYTLAAKVIPVSSLDEKEAVMNEVEIMSKLRHARLIQLYDVFVQQFKITLIMELITGGELFERVIDESFELDEATCEKFMREILQGVEYIHSQHVLHLDLKPENILCLSRTGFKIKIIDFGLAREVTEGEMRVMFGTPEFVAPEIISYDPVTYATDMWSVGVICYVLLSGLSPFMGDNESETLSNIVRCNYTFDYPEFKDISADAKDFIRKLLHKNPSKRNSATQCLSHP
uniref:Protein kinase domain-containing protein n=1 Tax=Mesocestoides corti TaxID=53468 RepID=A0A5K3G2D0_MESCO